MGNKNLSERDKSEKLAGVVGLEKNRHHKRAATMNGGALGGER